MLKLSELRCELDQLLPSQDLSDYCPNGLQVEGKKEIRTLATAVSASLATLEAAAKLQVDALIVHHGLFWRHDSEVIEGVKREKIFLLLEQGISLFAYHLPLDLNSNIGNNWTAARELGLVDLSPFGLVGKVPIGVKGYILPTIRQQFKQKLENYYRHPAYCALGGNEEIKTVAIVSGGAHKMIDQAIREQLDAFVTGSFDEPVWHQAFEGQGINFFALGHSATERVGARALADYLAKKFHLPCSFIDIENPF